MFVVAAAGSYLAIRDIGSNETPTDRQDYGNTRLDSESKPTADADRSSNGQAVASRLADSEVAALASFKLPDTLNVGGKEDLLTLSPEEIKLLHARQQLELEQMLNDTDAIALQATSDGEPGMTVREILALHEKQKSEASAADRSNEIVIPAGDDGTPALSVSALRDIHDRQQVEFAANGNAEEIVIEATTSGAGPMTRADLQALHARQRSMIDGRADAQQQFVAPLPEAGDPYLTVNDVQEMHNK